jgi:hypothetical protein
MAPCVEQYCTAQLKNSWIKGKSLLFEQLQDVPALRLRSRNPIWIDPGPTNTVYELLERWREMWLLLASVHGDLLRDLTVEPPWFDLRRREWVLLNRFRTSQGTCVECTDGVFQMQLTATVVIPVKRWTILLMTV